MGESGGLRWRKLTRRVRSWWASGPRARRRRTDRGVHRGRAGCRSRSSRGSPGGMCPRRTIFRHDRRSRCRAQAGVPISADETSAWDDERAGRPSVLSLLLCAITASRQHGAGLRKRPRMCPLVCPPAPVFGSVEPRSSGIRIRVSGFEFRLCFVSVIAGGVHSCPPTCPPKAAAFPTSARRSLS